ncbi:MAG: hypothetical protein AAFX79_06210 [Planctomycetota bacterium]
MKHARSNVGGLLAAVLVLLGLAIPATAQQPAPGGDAASLVAAALEDAMAQLEADVDAAVAGAERARTIAIAYAPPEGYALIVEAIEAEAFAQLAARSPEALRGTLQSIWNDRPALARALARVAEPTDDATRTVLLAGEIAKKDAELVDQYAELAAAICVVHDMPRVYPGVGPVRPDPIGIFDAFVFADRERRVTDLPLDATPAEMLVHVVDTSLTPEMLRELVLDRRGGDVAELYADVPYVQPELLGGEAALPPEQYALNAIRDRGGDGAIRSFYAEQIGQAFGVAATIATGYGGDERFQAPAYITVNRGTARWSFDLLPGNAGQPVGAYVHPSSAITVPLSDLEVTASLATAGTAAADRAWALLRAAEHLASGTTGPPADARAVIGADPLREVGTPAALEMLRASIAACDGLPGAHRLFLRLSLEQAGGDAPGFRRVAGEFLDAAERGGYLFFAVGEVLATLERAPAAINPAETTEWITQRVRRSETLTALLQVRLGDGALAAGEAERAAEIWNATLTRYVDDTPLALEAFDRLDRYYADRGEDEQRMQLFARSHRRMRAPRTGDEAAVRASAFYRVGERYEALLTEAGRDREAERLRRSLDQAIR